MIHIRKQAVVWYNFGNSLLWIVRNWKPDTGILPQHSILPEPLTPHTCYWLQKILPVPLMAAIDCKKSFLRHLCVDLSDTSQTSHCWTDGWRPSEILAYDGQWTSKTSQRQQSWWFSKKIAWLTLLNFGKWKPIKMSWKPTRKHGNTLESCEN